MHTTIEGHDSVATAPLHPLEPYKDVNDLPTSMRMSIVALGRRGSTNQEIADLFSLPVQWVQLFTECPPGSPEH